MGMEYLNYSLNDFVSDCQNLLGKIKELSCKTILAIAKGGLWPGVWFSNVLDIPMIVTSVRSYEANGQKLAVPVISLSQTNFLVSPVLIVDDIADTGQTLKIVTSLLNNFDYKILTLLCKERSEIIPHFYARKVPDNVWVVFPWERQTIY